MRSQLKDKEICDGTCTYRLKLSFTELLKHLRSDGTVCSSFVELLTVDSVEELRNNQPPDHPLRDSGSFPDEHALSMALLRILSVKYDDSLHQWWLIATKARKTILETAHLESVALEAALDSLDPCFNEFTSV